jgi:hypothetical protein
MKIHLTLVVDLVMAESQAIKEKQVAIGDYFIKNFLPLSIAAKLTVV